MQTCAPFHIKGSREDQDAFALRSQSKAAAAQKDGRLAKEIVPVTIPQRKGDPVVVDKDEHPRETSMEALGKLRTPFRENGSVTTRITGTAALEMRERGAKKALATMCIGVGQGHRHRAGSRLTVSCFCRQRKTHRPRDRSVLYIK